MDTAQKIQILNIAKDLMVTGCEAGESVPDIYRELRDLVNEEPGQASNSRDQAA